ncbi:MAG: isoaspartyl peptidase/L-asparaginase [Cyanobacteria bacterium]|nr:isoaspartyl peptidase/L-asparaginase [Cyanobacteriota bacterium]
MTIQPISPPRDKSFAALASRSFISNSPLFEKNTPAKATSLKGKTSSFGQSGSSTSKIQAWHQKIAQLPEGVRSVTQTFGELVMQDSESLLYSPRYPEPLTQIPRYPRPTDIGQEKMALNLAKRLKKLGLQVQLDEHFNVIGSLKSNLPPNFPHKAKLPVVALKAHLDTTYEQPGKNIIPQLHPQYGGGVLTVSNQNYLGNLVKLDPGDTPALRKRVGEDIINECLAAKIVIRVSDGFSLAQSMTKSIQEAQSHQTDLAAIALDQTGVIAWGKTCPVLLGAYHNGTAIGDTLELADGDTVGSLE